MDREQLIAKLSANEHCPFDTAELAAMPDSALSKLEAKLESGCSSPAANAQQGEAAPQEVAAPADVQALIQELGGVEGVKSALASIQAHAQQQQAAAEARKGELVAELKDNERCAFDEGELQGMTLGQLEKLASSLKPASYEGRGGPRGNSKPETEEPHQVPPPPAIILAKPE